MYYVNEQMMIFILLQYPNTNNINTNMATTKIKTRPQLQRFYLYRIFSKICSTTKYFFRSPNLKN